MRIKDKETLEEKYLRQKVLYDNHRECAPLIIIIFIVAIVFMMLYFSMNSTSELNTVGSGNPYNCINCRDNKVACKEHRNFDTDAALKNKIYGFCSKYSLDDDEETSKFDMYGYGNEYNTACDFCNSEKEECYSCRYDRITIISEVKQLEESDAFINRLCDDCWKAKQAKCNKCRDMLSYEVYNSIKNG